MKVLPPHGSLVANVAPLTALDGAFLLHNLGRFSLVSSSAFYGLDLSLGVSSSALVPLEDDSVSIRPLPRRIRHAGGGRRAFIPNPGNSREMSSNPAIEVRLELYVDGGLSEQLASRISSVLSQRWPGAWDVKVPLHPSFEHPAEWRAVVPLLAGTTAETLHRQMAENVLSLDASHTFHFRTRWSFQESPNHQEVYEERWKLEGT